MAIVIDLPGRSSRGFGRWSDTPEYEIEPRDAQDFLGTVLGRPQRLHYVSRDKRSVAIRRGSRGYDYDRVPSEYKVPTVSLAVQSAHQAFALHVPYSLNPDTVWYFVVSQVAEYVRQHPDRHASLFTSTPGVAQEIKVRDDSLRYDAPSDWGRAIELFRDPLRKRVTDRTLELFLPSFSTSTPETETALLVAFMDAASPYYKFTMQTMCGIPQIRLEGSDVDWQKLYERTEHLARTFDGLRGYFSDLLPVVQQIAQTAAGDRQDEEFWRSFYKYNETSGGEYVSGWINAFFAFLATDSGQVVKTEFGWRALARTWGGGVKANQFPSHVSKVPFVWEYYGRKIDMAFAAGVTGVDYDSGFLTPQLGFAVAEV